MFCVKVSKRFDSLIRCVNLLLLRSGIQLLYFNFREGECLWRIRINTFTILSTFPWLQMIQTVIKETAERVQKIEDKIVDQYYTVQACKPAMWCMHFALINFHPQMRMTMTVTITTPDSHPSNGQMCQDYRCINTVQVTKIIPTELNLKITTQVALSSTDLLVEKDYI